MESMIPFDIRDGSSQAAGFEPSRISKGIIDSLARPVQTWRCWGFERVQRQYAAPPNDHIPLGWRCAFFGAASVGGLFHIRLNLRCRFLARKGPERVA